MTDETKGIIQSTVYEMLYGKITLPKVEKTIETLKEKLGGEYIISYALPDGNPDDSVKFLFARKKTPDSEYTVWTFEFGPDK
jgi:hypothetical protein